jgi:16S rRNA A1518/A1519 N6-dimethyltransferase RsmA/KsgA/DIM1 with predicted DNA glycosylase/AP lyase activity
MEKTKMIKNFYPTPEKLIDRMINKVDWKNIETVLEPSAGNGKIVKELQNFRHFRHFRHAFEKISCIEINPELVASLKGKSLNVIDYDFLKYQGRKHFDLIIANPPFDNGSKHLLKAIEIMFSGQIVFILNAETIKNPYTNERKFLAQKLTELNASVEFIPDSFLTAERKTRVEVALVYIDKRKDMKENLFEGCKKSKIEFDAESKGISVNSKDQINNLIEKYNATIKSGLTVLETYFKNYDLIHDLIKIGEDSYSQNFNDDVKTTINEFIDKTRVKYWKKVLTFENVKRRLTSKELSIFYTTTNEQAKMELTRSNISTFILNLINNFENILDRAVEDCFESMTRKHSWYEETTKNIHYYNGWKTNKSFFVNKKVIIPFYSGAFFDTYSGEAKLKYGTKGQLKDIDLVMNYFTEPCGLGLTEALDLAFSNGQTRKIKTSHFIATVYKKGTIHLTFRDENTRLRFNVKACKGREWLPQDYGVKPYKELTNELKDVVNGFEGENKYKENRSNAGYICIDELKLLN